MKKFARHRSLDELKALCAERGFAVNTDAHDRRGSDFVHLTGMIGNAPVNVFYSVFNGTFFGETPSGRRFNESSDLDHVPWYAALLDLFFVGEAAHG